MRTNLIRASFFILCLFPAIGWGQLSVDSDQSTPANTETLVDKVDSARVADSLEQEALILKLQELNSSSESEKDALRAQLDAFLQQRTQRAENIKREIDSLRLSSKGAPVMLEKDTLFIVYARQGSLSAEERAGVVSDKLARLADDPEFDPELIEISENDGVIDLRYQSTVLLSLGERDGFWENSTPAKLALLRKHAIIQGVEKYRSDASWFGMLKRIALIILVIVLLIGIIILLNKLSNRLINKISLTGNRFLKGIKIRSYELVSPEREIQVLQWLLVVLKWIFILFVFYLSLPIVFSIFPRTEGIAHMLFGYVTSPILSIVRSLIGFIPELITILVILGVTHYFIKFLKFMTTEIQEGKLVISGFYPDWATPTFNLVRVLVYAFSFIVIFPYLPGSDSPVFQGVSVFLGLLISLGSSSAIGNIIAGLVITYMRPFKLGDRVKIGDVTGDVIEKNLLVTRLRTIKNEDISMPNSAILNGNTVNYSSSAKELGLILNTTVTIGYDVHWTKVHALLIDAALKTKLIKSEPKPFVLQTGLEDFYVSYQLNAYTETPEKAAVIYSEMHSNIQDAFKAAGIEILSPHYRAHRDDAGPTIPKDDA